MLWSVSGVSGKARSPGQTLAPVPRARARSTLPYSQGCTCSGMAVRELRQNSKYTKIWQDVQKGVGCARRCADSGAVGLLLSPQAVSAPDPQHCSASSSKLLQWGWGCCWEMPESHSWPGAAKCIFHFQKAPVQSRERGWVVKSLLGQGREKQFLWNWWVSERMSKVSGCFSV